MREILSALFRAYGQAVTLTRDGKTETFSAFVQPLRREVASQVYGNQYLEKHTEIICCTLGYRAGIIGAAMLAKQA